MLLYHSCGRGAELPEKQKKHTYVMIYFETEDVLKQELSVFWQHWQ